MSSLAANTITAGHIVGRYAVHGDYAEAVEYHDLKELDTALSGAAGSRLVILTRDQQLPEPATIVEVVRNPTPVFAVALLQTWGIQHYAGDEIDARGGLIVRVRADGPDETCHVGPVGTPVPYSATYSADLRGWSDLQLAVITQYARVRELPCHLVAATEYGIEMSLPLFGRTVGAANFASEAEARTYLHDRVRPETRPAILTRTSYPRRARRSRRPLTHWTPVPTAETHPAAPR